MNFTGNQRLISLGQSAIRTMTTACTRVKGINLAQGVCDTAVPQPVMNGAKEAMDSGTNIYTRFDGLPLLREALAQKLKFYNTMEVNSDTQITVSAGATGAFHCACMALLNPGDEVILFEPYYGYHVSTLLAVEAVPRVVSLRVPSWDVSMEELECAISKQTKAIVVNTPGNPSGKVFTRKELEDIASLAIQNDLLVLTDEIYEYFLYDQREHVSLGSLAEMAERTITISGYSKTFSITGWRIGYSVASPLYAEWIGAMNDLVYVCAPAPLQAGVAAGIRELDRSFYQKVQTTFQAKRDQFCGVLERIGWNPIIPQGSYYVLADVSKVPGTTGKDRAMWILEKTGVAGVPGEAFFQGTTGAQYVRFSFAKKDGELHEACERLLTLR